MKVKKLEITGFKSFPDKAVIEFPQGISAFVGPNGCGKSNIIDAIRWVMGEQSVKQLRGKAMEDMIFSGTNGKPPVNLTEVSLILSNENGHAPEELRDFTEIMLTRRLFRSGESAYFINKQPCRLKDINNVFLGSGVGSKSYAVVQQGNIGAITDAGPDERRIFIDEAAGITRYKNRKNEALRKIQVTNQNLLRVMDIISEIKRQMSGLKRQARKAERYKRIQEHIRRIDVCLSLNYYDDYTQLIDKTAAILTGLTDTDLEHTSRLKQLDASAEEIKLRRSRKGEEISDRKSRKFETHRKIDKIENELVYLRKDIERLKQETSELESARENLEEKKKNLKTEIAQEETRNTALKMEIETARSSHDQERSASKNVSERLAGLNQDLDGFKADLMDLMSQEIRYKNIYQNATNSKESLRRRLARKNEEEAGAKNNVEELLKKETRAKEKLSAVKAQIGELDKDLKILRAQLDEKSNQLGKQVKHVQTLEHERNQIRSKHSALKKMEENFEWYKSGVRVIMKRLKSEKEKNPDRNGIIGLMADIIDPEPSFEAAVEAALGESLQYILVKDRETALQAIDHLQTTGEGRSGFIPISSVKNIESGHEDTPAPREALLNHVSVKGGYEKIGQALLGHVVLAEDMEAALRVFNGNGKQQTIVTKNGDVISHQGIMIGGSKEKLSGILSKKQEIKSLENQIDSCDKKMESGRHDQTRLESEARALETKTQKLIEQKNKTGQEEIEAEKTLYQSEEALKMARRHLEIVCLEQEQLLGEEIDIDAEMTKYDKAVSEIENRLKAAQQKVTETSREISSVSSEMEEFNKRIVDLKLILTARNAGLENSSSTLRRLKEFQDDNIKRGEELVREISLRNQKRAASKQKIMEYERTLSEMYADMNRIEKEIENTETEYQDIEAKLKDSDSLMSNIQSQREEALKKIRLLELDLSEQQINRDNIANRLKERYHKSISEIKSHFDGETSLPDMSVEKMEEELARCNAKIEKIEDVNLGAIKEYDQLKERFDFLHEQQEDLVKAVEDLHRVIKKINKITKDRFLKTFDAINEKIKEVFPALFEGGSARLELTDPDNPLETGVEFLIHPPGKKLTRMSLLSGGEKALSAIAFIFSIFLIKPASFCLMDEIDAPLDEVNIFRFNNLLKIVREKYQIIMITHNKRSMEFADTLFGITMENKGISKIVSVNFNPVKN
ncbi:MAG: chromosome segregation protein SMC [Pseudomonadota bacterium]